MSITPSQNSELDQNKELIQRFYDEVVNQRNVDALGDYFLREDSGGSCGELTMKEMVSYPAFRGQRLVPAASPELEERASRDLERGATRDLDRGKEQREPVGELDAWRDFTTHVLAAFPDMIVNIDSLVAEGDTVVVHWSARGTHLGEFLGTAPTRQVVPFSSTDFFTIQDGKIASHRGYPDSARVLAKLGQLPRTPIARVLAGLEEDETPLDRPSGS